MSSVGAHLRISGVVQGVGYRYFCYMKATQLDLVGWVRNNPDSSVEVTVEGDRGAVEAYIDQLRIGPYSAVVRGFDVKWLEFTGEFKSFNVSH